MGESFELPEYVAACLAPDDIVEVRPAEYFAA
jgi:hypothetical protein